MSIVRIVCANHTIYFSMEAIGAYINNCYGWGYCCDESDDKIILSMDKIILNLLIKRSVLIQQFL